MLNREGGHYSKINREEELWLQRTSERFLVSLKNVQVIKLQDETIFLWVSSRYAGNSQSRYHRSPPFIPQRNLRSVLMLNYITLIPKKSAVVELANSRPTSLIGSFDKIISNILI